MGRVNREIQIKFGSEENDIKYQLQCQLELPDTDFKLQYRQDRTEEFRAINDFVANDDNNEIKEILVLYEGTKEEEEEFLKNFNEKGRKDGDLFDIRIGDSFWVQARIMKFGESTLNYDLIVTNKSNNGDMYFYIYYYISSCFLF